MFKVESATSYKSFSYAAMIYSAAAPAADGTLTGERALALSASDFVLLALLAVVLLYVVPKHVLRLLQQRRGA
jgi:hypothetical protein